MDKLDEGMSVSYLLSDFRSEVIDYRIACAKRLSTIALALGPQRLRDELLPVISGIASYFLFHNSEIIFNIL